MKGGKAENKTAEDIAMKHHQFVGTVEQQIEKGTKIEMEHTDNPEIAKQIAMDHLWEYYEYYSDKDGLPAMEKGLEKYETNESITNKIRRVLRENTELSITDETPTDISYKIMVDGHEAGSMVIKPTKLSESDAIEIMKITLNDKFKSIKVIKDGIGGILPIYNKIDRLVVSPVDEIVNMNFSGADWGKIGFTRLNDDFLIRLRGH